MKKCIFYLCLLLALVPAMMSEQNKQQKKITIMGMGDSITEGGNSFTCYLYPLWEKLYAAGYETDFIGPRKSKNRLGTLDHCGFGGKTVEFLDSLTDSIYKKYPADIVLLHAGHNHFVEQKPVAGMIASYKSIIGKIKKINPKACILIAKVIESGKLPKYSYIPELNKEIEDMVDSMNDKNVRLVDMAEKFDWTRHTIKDKVHPNAEGADIMASVWLEELKKVLPKPKTEYKPEIAVYKVQPNGKEMKLHIFRNKKAKTDKPSAAIVYFFGGGWANGTPLQFYRECDYYSSKGMTAITVDYRIRSIDGTSPFESIEDTKDAMRWIRSHASELNIDPERIAAGGASAGGQLAAALGTLKDGKENGGVSYRPNLMLLYYPVVDNGPDGYGPKEMKERYKDVSPLHNIDRKTPPSLFLIGDKDHLIPINTAEAFRDKCEKNGTECELHVFKGCGHPIFSYRKPLDKVFYDVRKLTDDFLKKYGYMK